MRGGGGRKEPRRPPSRPKHGTRRQMTDNLEMVHLNIMTWERIPLQAATASVPTWKIPSGLRTGKSPGADRSRHPPDSRPMTVSRPMTPRRPSRAGRTENMVTLAGPSRDQHVLHPKAPCSIHLSEAGETCISLPHGAARCHVRPLAKFNALSGCLHPAPDQSGTRRRNTSPKRLAVVCRVWKKI